MSDRDTDDIIVSAIVPFGAVEHRLPDARFVDGVGFARQQAIYDEAENPMNLRRPFHRLAGPETLQ
jgi:hypothetical protein